LPNEVEATGGDEPESVELYIKTPEGEFVPVEIDDQQADGGYLIAAQRSEHMGPLPSVEQFRAYGEVVPDAPERILRMAEKDQQAYHDFMAAQLTGRLSAVSQGQWMGFVAMMVALMGAIYLAVIGQTIVATALASPSVIIPIMRFYYAGKHPAMPEKPSGKEE